MWPFPVDGLCGYETPNGLLSVYKNAEKKKKKESEFLNYS